MCDGTAERLLAWFAPLANDGAGCGVALSGGVDSSVLAAAAHRVLGSRAVAVTAHSASTKQAEIVAACEVATTIGISHRLFASDELLSPLYTANNSERCYHCKITRFIAIINLLRSEGFAIIVEGTTADDATDFRPGTRATRELGLRSPLAELGLTKEDVRAIARRWSLPSADKPAEPCLATRIAYGVTITTERLARIAAAEAFLNTLGIQTVRVRLHHDELARVEIADADIPHIIKHSSTIVRKLRELGFTFVSLDLEGFQTGKMNRVL